MSALLTIPWFKLEGWTFPGTHIGIQPFGVLFALDEKINVTQVSENVSDHLSLRVDDVLGRPLSDSIDTADAQEVQAVLREQRWHDANPLSIGARGQRFDGIVHHHEGVAILELDYVRPLDRPEKGWVWQFSMTPGF